MKVYIYIYIYILLMFFTWHATSSDNNLVDYVHYINTNPLCCVWGKNKAEEYVNGRRI